MGRFLYEDGSSVATFTSNRPEMNSEETFRSFCRELWWTATHEALSPEERAAVGDVPFGYGLLNIMFDWDGWADDLYLVEDIISAHEGEPGFGREDAQRVVRDLVHAVVAARLESDVDLDAAAMGSKESGYEDGVDWVRRFCDGDTVEVSDFPLGPICP